MSEFDEEFEKLGEPEVRRRFESKRGLHNTRWDAAKSWLALKESQRQLLVEIQSANREVREEKILRIAYEANRLALEANTIARNEAAAASRSARWAMYSAIIAATAVVFEARELIFSLIFGKS